MFWLATFLGGGSFFFKDYSVNWETATRIFSGVLFLYVMWGVIWWAIKTALLRWFVGFTKQERRDAFSSRMDRPYDVADLVSRFSERRIRITDMIGRRGRFITLAVAGFYYLYLQVATSRTPTSPRRSPRTTCSTASSPAGSSSPSSAVNGLLGAFFYGPQSRVMDGVLARANCLLIATLWTAFKFVMVPIGVSSRCSSRRRSSRRSSRCIWGSYLVTDASAEIFGSLFGQQTDSRVGASATSTASRSPVSSRDSSVALIFGVRS